MWVVVVYGRRGGAEHDAMQLQMLLLLWRFWGRRWRRWLGLSTSVGLPPFSDLVRNISATLSDPGADKTLYGLSGRGPSHNVLDFLKMGSVKLKCEDGASDLTAFDHRRQVALRRKLHPILRRVLNVLRWGSDALQQT